MIVYPAIDIRGGRCVRLVEGDFSRETQFDADPADAAKRWAAEGAQWIHVVDLDGAVAGLSMNAEAIERIVNSVAVPVQLGGGIRTTEQAEFMLNLGLERVIIGTSAIREPEMVKSLASVWGARIAIGLDARGGKLAAAGWLDQTDVQAVEVAASLTAAGIKHVIYTDIHRDGTLTGPNLPALEEMISVAGDGVIASGGIGTIEDVANVRATGAGGVIIGRALYDGRVQLAEAIRLASGDNLS